MAQSLDAIPSVTKQGFSVQLLKSKVGGYNAGILQTKDGLLYCTRIVTYEPFEGHERLKFVLAWFKQKDVDGEGFNLEHLGNIEMPGFDPDGHAEDPRIFRGPNDSIYVSFCHATDKLNQPPCQRLAKFEDGNLFKATLLPMITYEGNGDSHDPKYTNYTIEQMNAVTLKPQKNWNFFFQGERLFFIYWTYPHRVVEIHPETMVVIQEWNAGDDKLFAWQYGPLAGGTPPIVWRGKYLSFYHGWMPHQIRRRRYYMGAYTFEMEAPFRILEITPPLLRGSLNDPTNFEPPNHAGLPLVVFPCGLLMEQKDPDQCIVSMGVNDSYSAVGSFDLRLLPLRPVAEMREPKTFYFFTQDTSIPPRATQRTNLAWIPSKNDFGGILATQNPMAIDDCLTRGGVSEITKEMYYALLSDVPAFDGVPQPEAAGQAARMQGLFPKIVESVCRLPGWSTPEKNIEFASIVLAMRPEVAVEIGVYGGRSLLSIALAMEVAGRGVVHGIDPWSPRDSVEGEVKANVEWWGELDHESIYRTCVAAVDRFGVNDYVKIQRKRSDQAEIPDNIGLLIIDGNHGAGAPGGDVERYVPKVAVGGIIYMDDISWAGGHVHKAAARLEEEFGCKLLYSRDEGAMFQKLK